jgi:hypothetical protein
MKWLPIVASVTSAQGRRTRGNAGGTLRQAKAAIPAPSTKPFCGSRRWRG